MIVEYIVLPSGKGLPAPIRATPHSSGFDLRAAIDTPVRIDPGRIRVIPTGIALSIPHGFEGQLRARSGLAAKHGICLVNGLGTVDADYRGEVKLALYNAGLDPFLIERGNRLAQLCICPVMHDAELQLVQTLAETVRGEGGFGSTGVE